MKQYQFTYQDDASFFAELEKIEQWRQANNCHTTLFRIYSDDMELAHIRHVCDILDEKMPDALYLGCTSHANILNGAFERRHIILSCTLFECETTRVQVLQFPFSETNAKDVVGELKAFCGDNPWVSAVELHVTMLGMSIRSFCDEMSTLSRNIQVFGGGAYNPNMDDTDMAVFSKGNGMLSRGIVFLLLGGEDFHVYSTLISGWKPLRRKFHVTKSKREMLYEIDGEPAFNVYRKFLNVSRDDKLISNTLEFPLFMDYKGVDVMRCALGINDEDALQMATEVPEGTTVQLSYGDPETILNSIRHDGQKIANFQPEVIQTFSCAARKAFWGDENISDETILLGGVAPTSGFYTSGEFLRLDGVVRNYNVTLVLAAMREGGPKQTEVFNLYDQRLDNLENDRIPLIWRFVSFIEASTNELEDLNQRLALASITDGLTGLYNRAEIEERISAMLNDPDAPNPSLIMLDIDNFKRINDRYGHKEGDRVIIALAELLKQAAERYNGSVGRWGGEEFMMLLPDHNLAEAAEIAEEIRVAFAELTFEAAGKQTVSLGAVQARPGENTDVLYNWVDKALYTAKDNGKNQVLAW